MLQLNATQCDFVYPFVMAVTKYWSDNCVDQVPPSFKCSEAFELKASRISFGQSRNNLALCLFWNPLKRYNNVSSMRDAYHILESVELNFWKISKYATKYEHTEPHYVVMLLDDTLFQQCSDGSNLNPPSEGVRSFSSHTVGYFVQLLFEAFQSSSSTPWL